MFNLFKKKAPLVDRDAQRDALVSNSREAMLNAARGMADAAAQVTAEIRAELEASNLRFETVSAIMSDALLICDLDGTITSYNQSASAMFDLVETGGYVGDLLETKATPADIWQYLESTFESDLLIGKSISTGKTFRISVNHAHLTNAKGKPMILMAIKDATNGHPVCDYKAAFEASLNGIVIVLDEVIVAGNEAAAVAFGVDQSKMVGMQFTKLVADDTTTVQYSSTEIVWAGATAALYTIQTERNPANDNARMICCFDGDFKITFANYLFAHNFGKNACDLVGVDIRDLMDADEKTLFQTHIGGITPEKPVRRMQFRKKNINRVWSDYAHYHDDTVEYQRVGRNLS